MVKCGEIMFKYVGNYSIFAIPENREIEERGKNKEERAVGGNPIKIEIIIK